MKYIFFLLLPVIIFGQSAYRDTLYNSGAVFATNNLGQATSSIYNATNITLTRDCIIDSVEWNGKKQGTPDFGITPEIWSYNTGDNLPGTLLVTGTQENAGTAFGESYTFNVFSFAGTYEHSAGDKLFVVLHSDSYDAANYIRIAYWSDDNSGLRVLGSAVPEWTTASADGIRIIIHSHDPAATTDTPKRKFGSYGGWGGW